MGSNACFVAVHAGAGWHASSKEAGYEMIMRHAVSAATQALAGGASALDALVAAMRLLEDCPLTNAGYGSNLTRGGAPAADGSSTHGRVECDAAVMVGAGRSLSPLFGAVGAVSGITNPIAAAARLAVCSEEPLPCGLVPPIFLAGEGAWAWAQRQGLNTAPDWASARCHLISPAAVAAWHRYDAMLRDAHRADAATAPPVHADPRCDGRSGGSSLRATAVDGAAPSGSEGPASRPTAHVRLAEVADTVGAVVVDATGRVASGVSSGGLAMKVEGRVGEAAVLGGGCWAEGASSDGQGVVASVSGVGEAVMRANLARALASALRPIGTPPVDEVAMQVLQQTVLAGPPPWDVGVLLARVEERCDSPVEATPLNTDGPGMHAPGLSAVPGRLCTSAAGSEASDGSLGAVPSGSTIRIEFCAVHSAASFAVAYQGPDMAAPHSIILRKPEATGTLPPPQLGDKRPRACPRGAAGTHGCESQPPSMGAYGYITTWHISPEQRVSTASASRM